MAIETVRHDALRNGDVVVNHGYRFAVYGYRLHPETETEPAVVRYYGAILDPSDRVALGSGYDGGVYGARADILCTREVA